MVQVSQGERGLRDCKVRSRASTYCGLALVLKKAVVRSGGRFVEEFGCHGNVSAKATGIEFAFSLRGVIVASPWFFSRPEEYKQLLEASVFKVENIVLIPRPTPLPRDVGGWVARFAQPYTSALPESERKRFISEVVETLVPCSVMQMAIGRQILFA